MPKQIVEHDVALESPIPVKLSADQHERWRLIEDDDDAVGKIWFEGDLAAIFSRLSNVSVYWFKLWAECFTAYNYRSLYSKFK